MCIAWPRLFLVAAILSSRESRNVKSSDGADLLSSVTETADFLKGLLQEGPLLGDILESFLGVGSLLVGEDGLVGNVVGERVLLGDLLDSDDDDVIKSSIHLFSGVIKTIARLAKNLTNALRGGVDVHDSKGLTNVFSAMPVNQVCPACHLLSDSSTKTACKKYCLNTCNWQF